MRDFTSLMIVRQIILRGWKNEGVPSIPPKNVNHKKVMKDLAVKCLGRVCLKLNELTSIQTETFLPTVVLHIQAFLV